MSNRKKKAKLYALSTCPACRRTKKFLAEQDIEVEIIEVDLLGSSEKWVASKEMKSFNPEGTFPTLIVHEIIVGYDEDAISQAISDK